MSSIYTRMPFLCYVIALLVHVDAYIRRLVLVLVLQLNG
jgi:hypothetical protein